MPRATALEFQRRFGEFQHQAQREPGYRAAWPAGICAESADHYDWLVAVSKRTHRTAEMPTVVLDAIERAEMDPKHAVLDELLK